LVRFGDAVVHFHLVLWLPVGVRLPKPDLCGWWPHGFSRIESVRSAVGYCASYVSKLEVCERFPRGLRLSGRGGLCSDSRREVRFWCAPRYVREAMGLGADPFRFAGNYRRARRAGWVDRMSGVLVYFEGLTLERESSEVPRGFA
jgi:hypothetical protein